MDPTLFPSHPDVAGLNVAGNDMSPEHPGLYSFDSDFGFWDYRFEEIPHTTMDKKQLRIMMSHPTYPPYPFLDVENDSPYHVGTRTGLELGVQPHFLFGKRHPSPRGYCDLSSNAESENSPSPRSALCYPSAPWPYCHNDAGLVAIGDGTFGGDNAVTMREVQHYPDHHESGPDCEIETEIFDRKSVTHIYPHNHLTCSGDVDADSNVDAPSSPYHAAEDRNGNNPLQAPPRKQTETSPAQRRNRGGKTPLKKAGKRGLRRAAVGKSSPKAKSNNTTATRHFVCSFSHYGCTCTFVSKNEWKRHFNSQHLQLGFYRCDLGACQVEPQSHDGGSGNPRSPNDFNRKDLFTQHLRRMHYPWSSGKSPSPKEREEFEKGFDEIRQRCWQVRRRPPENSRCGFCHQTFAGPHGWEDRMEHVGKHFERGETRAEAEDVDLRAWALQEGIICPDGNGKWILSVLAKYRRGVHTV